MKTGQKIHVLFAGGGTGGHLFPAVAVAEKVKEYAPHARILFIGTKDKIEGRVVPKLGYEFKSIWIKGFSRKMNLENLLFPVKLIVSTLHSLWIAMRFKPDVAVGSGGYVSGPVIYAANIMGAKIILLEQNSYPGITTRLLEKSATHIHTSFEETSKYLRNKKAISVTGNPVRSSLNLIEKSEAKESLGLDSSKKTICVLGGSLGARSINETIAESLDVIKDLGVQLFWQTGKGYYDAYKHLESENIKVVDFIDDMNSFYSACDLLIARAGATTIAEIEVLGIPTIMVPSPHVAANHQYHNAKALADKEAALLIEDKNIKQELPKVLQTMIKDDEKMKSLRKNILQLGKPDAADIIAKQVIELANG